MLGVVVGEPEFYQRFGFQPAQMMTLASSYQQEGGVLQIIDLVPDVLEGYEGEISLCEEFSESV